MTKEKFGEIWDNIVLKLYEELNGSSNKYMAIWSKQRIYYHYQKQKTFLKKSYMKNPNTHLDRHKIAACMMFAIVKVQPIRIQKKDIIKHFLGQKCYDVKDSLLNEYVGLYTALSIVESFIEYKGKSEGISDHDIMGQVSFDKRVLTLPDTFNDADYVYNTCLDLYFSRKRNKVNILTFSNVFFLLERIGICKLEDSERED